MPASSHINAFLTLNILRYLMQKTWYLWKKHAETIKIGYKNNTSQTKTRMLVWCDRTTSLKRNRDTSVHSKT